MLATLVDTFAYFFKSKKWWMVPIVGVLLVFGFVLFLAQGSIVAPFIYTVF